MRPSVVVLLLASACVEASSPATLTRDGEWVAIEDDIPNHCEVIGDANAKSAAADLEKALEWAKIELRNRTAAMGGDHVALQKIVRSGHEIRLRGKALKCTEAPTPTPKALPKPREAPPPGLSI
jgi:hypothetical protein